MNWDQIESKWAAMTRRVRADWTGERPNTLPKSARSTTGLDVKASTLAESKAGAGTAAAEKTFNE